MPPSKYQKKLLNIWKTFDPSDLDAESELNEFIMKYHPSVGEMKDIVSKRIDDLNKAIDFNPNECLLYKNRAFAKSKLGDNAGADEDDRKADKLKNNL